MTVASVDRLLQHLQAKKKLHSCFIEASKAILGMKYYLRLKTAVVSFKSVSY